jgi:hypothetical protein
VETVALKALTWYNGQILHVRLFMAACCLACTLVSRISLAGKSSKSQRRKLALKTLAWYNGQILHVRLFMARPAVFHAA